MKRKARISKRICGRKSQSTHKKKGHTGNSARSGKYVVSLAKSRSTFVHATTAGNVVSIRSGLGISASTYNQTAKEIKKISKSRKK